MRASGCSTCTRRFNNWGIAPAAAGLRRARGEYVSVPVGRQRLHARSLRSAGARARSRDRRSASSTARAGTTAGWCSNHPVPRPGRIDLGQPLFRRELFELYFDDDLPFDMMAWDWHLVDALMRRGVRWRHVDRPSFIFRLGEVSGPARWRVDDLATALRSTGRPTRGSCSPISWRRLQRPSRSSSG